CCLRLASPVLASFGQTLMAPADEPSPPATPAPGGPPPARGPAGPADVPAPGPPKLLVVLFTAAFAFLLASFPAPNSDVWMRLAAGRQLAQGLERPSLTGPERAAAPLQSGWLSDVLCYALYSAVGGPGLVLGKALLVVGLALLLLRLSQTGPPSPLPPGGWGIPAGCTALPLLTMSTRPLPQPAPVPYLFLALTLWLLRRGGRPDKETNRQVDEGKETVPSPRAWLPPWPLLVLLLLWANLDSWFVLGLGTVALVSLGQTLDLA